MAHRLEACLLADVGHREVSTLQQALRLLQPHRKEELHRRGREMALEEAARLAQRHEACRSDLFQGEAAPKVRLHEIEHPLKTAVLEAVGQVEHLLLLVDDG